MQNHKNQQVSYQALSQICYCHPLGDIILATTTRCKQNAMGEPIFITLPRLKFLDFQKFS